MSSAAANPLRGRFAKSAAFGLVCLLLVFLLQVVPHGHANGQEEAACRICQVAHLGVALAVAVVALNVPLATLGTVAALTIAARTQTFFAHSPSRAPPLLGL